MSCTRNPITPYGRSKWMVEQILQDYDRVYGLKSVCLRYFNAAGANPQARIGERHQPETHLIPLILQAAAGRRAHISVFGTDYDTSDGTCIRDYIHVVDLCEAHLLALDYLAKGNESNAFNLGNGAGFSIHEVIEAARRVTGREIPAEIGPRRAGDPVRLVANSKAIQTLCWQPKRASLQTILRMPGALTRSTWLSEVYVRVILVRHSSEKGMPPEMRFFTGRPVSGLLISIGRHGAGPP